ncbi:MAG: CRISPR-associated endonuclease Cas1 [Firmicutes bacterium]|nr:CRISPR-associated endonuclease Cas1 [Bacillota bacterium]
MPAESGSSSGQIIISDFGAFVGKKSERLIIKQGKEIIEQVPFHNLQSLIISGSGISISADVIQECMEHGIQIDFLTFSGKPYAKLTSPGLSGTVITRREQLLAYYEKRGLRLAKAFIEGKLRNQQGLLHYFARYRKSENCETFDVLSNMENQIADMVKELETIDGKCVDDVREQLLSVEGRAGAIYWGGIKKLLASNIEFETREHRGANDPFNSLLNYGYGILYSTVWGAIVLAGLEPFAGFIHTDRPGKPSLCLDLVEEFRQRVVDRTVVSLVNRGSTIKLQEGLLTDQIRRKLIENIQERLEAKETYRGKQHKLKTIIQLQARRIASYLRGETDYKPFIGRW